MSRVSHRFTVRTLDSLSLEPRLSTSQNKGEQSQAESERQRWVKKTATPTFTPNVGNASITDVPSAFHCTKEKGEGEVRTAHGTFWKRIFSVFSEIQESGSNLSFQPPHCWPWSLGSFCGEAVPGMAGG